MVSPARKRHPKNRRVFGVAVLGELLITVGVLLLLFVIYQLWWTDVLGARAFAVERTELEQEWSAPGAALAEPAPIVPKKGKSFGLVYIPALRNRAWGVPVVEGTSREDLKKGMGHHMNTAMPGEIGNFTLAGHRTTYGAPLGDIDRMEAGDQVIIETKNGWYTYELDSHKIIKPWEGWILDPVPGLPQDAEPRQALLTMYSCHPKYSAAERFVWFGRLVKQSPRSDGRPPEIE